MSIYCGASFGGGQGYTDTCGKEEYGKGTPLAQCKQCMRLEIHNLKAGNEEMAKRLLFVDIVHGQKSEMRWAALVNENESLRKDAERYRQFRALTLNGLDDTPDEFDKEFDMQISSPENP